MFLVIQNSYIWCSNLAVLRYYGQLTATTLRVVSILFQNTIVWEQIYMGQCMIFRYLSLQRAAKAQASLYLCHEVWK